MSERFFLRPTEAAEVLGLSRSTVYRLIKDGVLPSVRLGRRGVRVPAALLQEWVAARVDEHRTAEKGLHPLESLEAEG